MAGEEGALAVLLRALQGLTVKDFQEFKTKLSAVPMERGWNIPKDSLAKAAHPCALVSSMSRIYSQDTAMDIAIGLFQEMNQRDLAEKLLAEQEKGRKPAYILFFFVSFCPLSDPGYKQKLVRAGFGFPGSLETQRCPGRQPRRSFPPGMGIKDISAEHVLGDSLEAEASPGWSLQPQGHEQRGTKAASGPRQLPLLSGWMRITGWADGSG